ncbi:hypothetical protein QQ045_008106 [Rhodiola kirilowii]
MSSNAASVTPDQPGGGFKKRKRISRVIRAVFIETSLARKIRNRKLRWQPPQWEIREPSSEDGSVDLNPTSPEATDQLSSPTGSDITTICLLSRDSRIKKRVKFSACFLPVTLLVLILWGKFCAIFFTSTVIFGIGRLSRGQEVSSGGRGLHLKHYLSGPLLDL